MDNPFRAFDVAAKGSLCLTASGLIASTHSFLNDGILIGTTLALASFLTGSATLIFHVCDKIKRGDFDDLENYDRRSSTPHTPAPDYGPNVVPFRRPSK